MNPTNHSQTAASLWSIADLLRGDFKQSQYGRIILSFTLLRRLECVLEATKQTVLAAAREHQTKPDLVREKLLLRAANQQFYNASPLSLGTLSDTQTADDLISYVQSFSTDAREIFEHFHFEDFVQQLATSRFDFMLSNLPFGVEWKKVQKQVTDEHKERGFDGRFGPGLPRVSDGSLLFLLHLVSKMRDPREGGSRIGIILNGSPLFTGGAGSGESEIRRYLLQNDLVEAIVALPTDMFYNTGIATYVWILSNNKPAPRRGQVQLIDGSQQFSKMRKSLGSKRQYLDEAQINQLVRLYGQFEATAAGNPEQHDRLQSKIFPNQAFGYRRITIERPLRLAFQVTEERLKAVLAEKVVQKLDGAVQSRLITALQTLEDEPVYLSRARFSKLLKQALAVHGLKPSAALLKGLLNGFGERHPEAEICRVKDKKDGPPEPDTGLRDYENVPLGEPIDAYFEREVKPHVPDAWIDQDKRDALDGEVGIVGFEIPFNRHFYVFQPPRPLEEIDQDLKACTDRIKQMIEELSA